MLRGGTAVRKTRRCWRRTLTLGEVEGLRRSAAIALAERAELVARLRRLTPAWGELQSVLNDLNRSSSLDAPDRHRFGALLMRPGRGPACDRERPRPALQDTRARSRAEDGWPSGQAGDRDAELRELPTFVHALGLAQVTISISLGRQDPSRLSCQLLSIQRLWKNRSVGL